MKRLRQILAAALVVFSFGVTTLAPATVSAATPKQTVCDALGSDKNCSTDPSGGASLPKLVNVIINIFSIVVGLVAVIMIIVSGLNYVTSGGDANKVSSAKNTLVFAIVGLVIVALAQFIVKFILNKTV